MVDMGVFAPPDSVANATIGLCVGDKNMQEGVIANVAGVGFYVRWSIIMPGSGWSPYIPTPPNHI